MSLSKLAQLVRRKTARLAEASFGELCTSIAAAELFRRDPERCDKDRVGVLQAFSNSDRKAMESRRRRFLEAIRLGVRMLLLDPGRAEHHHSLFSAAGSRLRDDVFDSAGYEFATLRLAEKLEAGKQGELEAKLPAMVAEGFAMSGCLMSEVLKKVPIGKVVADSTSIVPVVQEVVGAGKCGFPAPKTAAPPTDPS